MVPSAGVDAARCSTEPPASGPCVAVRDLGQLVTRLLQLLGRSLDGLDIGAGSRAALRLVDSFLGLRSSESAGTLSPSSFKRLLGGVDQRVGS